MLKIGLTGGIASGKSAVADILGELGATIIDTDFIARAVVEPETPGLKQIIAEFGDEVIAADGHLDRNAMRTRVFGDDAQRRKLEAILHPLIREATLDAIAAADGPYLVIVVPLLLETDFAELVDRILVVD
ncbi:MAG: dephospho-CoA kinase, partial [Gammaproteobacteria bacterium]|nr:dephospho-CoA kinase [Gammaproteobacteria bacterium]